MEEGAGLGVDGRKDPWVSIILRSLDGLTGAVAGSECPN